MKDLNNWEIFMSVQYKLRAISSYGDYRDDINTMVNDNGGQMSFEQYDYIYKLVNSMKGCNFLIFGLGKDSDLWIKSNENGKTVFLEDDDEWINICRDINGMDVRTVEYTNTGYDADRLLNEYDSGTNNLKLELDEDIRETKWDIIIVDGPACYGFDKPCRMKSIYESYNISKLNNDKADIFVHDVGKHIVKTYTNYFFKNHKTINTIGNCKCGGAEHCRCNILRHYKLEDKNNG